MINIVCLLLLVGNIHRVSSSHFRGGVIMMQPARDGGPKEMEISFRISWRRSSSEGGSCTQAVIDNGNLIGSGSLTCQGGCSGTVSTMAYQCTDFSASEDWSYGERRVKYVFEDSADLITIGFSGSAWISPFGGSWSLIAKTSLMKRNDTGKPNSTPRAVTAPVIRLQAGCNHTIKIGVDDPDGDTVRCRWASGSVECGSVCNRFPGAILDPFTCNLRYEATLGTGYKAAALMVEDFVPFDTEPLSSISLQFLIYVFNSNEPCSQKPEFVPPTIKAGQCVAIPSGSTFHEPLVAISGGEDVSVTEIQTASPPGVQKSNVEQSDGKFHVNMTWTPTPEQEDEIHQFCYTALNSAGLSSQQNCIDFIPGMEFPKSISTSQSPKEKLVFPHNTTWKIDFDQTILRASLSAFISFFGAESGKLAYQIDTSISNEFKIENNRTMIFSPIFEFEQKKDFYITFDRGVVTGTKSCKPGNEIMDNPSFWTFKTRDITPPSVTFDNADTITNQNVTITWTTDEESTDVCKRVFVDFPDSETSIEESCSSNTWSGFNLQEGNHQLQITSTDDVGNQADYKHSFYVDVTPPVVQFLNINGYGIGDLEKLMMIKEKYATLRYRCWDQTAIRTETCTYECLLETEGQSNKEFIPCPRGNAFYLSSSLAQKHNATFHLSVIAVDNVGNRGKPMRFQWRTDFQKPTITGSTTGIVSCDASLSPQVLGYPTVYDDLDDLPKLSYYDRNNGCILTRTWTATDHAGNSKTFIQTYTLEFEISISSVPILTSVCDSAASKVTVPQNSASVPNPCRRPIQIDNVDDPNIYTCPGTIQRQWTAIDKCSQQTTTVTQKIVLYDVCPPESCGRNYSEPHGICTLGRCTCNKPWYGENCNILIHEPKIDQLQDITIVEGSDYKQDFILIQGTQPVNWRLVEGPRRMKIDVLSEEVIFLRSQAGNYSISIEATNQVGNHMIRWNLIVQPTYKVHLDAPSETVYDTAFPVVLTGYVTYETGSIIKNLLAGYVPIEVDVHTKESKRTIKAFTTNDGKFTTVFYPTPREYGIFTANGRHPGEGMGSSSIQWNVKGMKLRSSYITLSGSSIESFSKTYSKINQLFNDGPLSIQNITIEANLGQIADFVELDISLNGSKSIATFQPLSSLNVDIKLNVKKPLRATLSISFKSSKGTRVFCTVSIQIDPILPGFNINPSTVNTRVVRGSSKVIQFNITNTGQAIAHSVHGLVPETGLMSLISFTKSDGSRQIFDMDSGENAVMDLLVQIPESQSLGEISASVLVSSKELGKTIPVKIIVSSDLKMTLTVVVEDEFTYFADGNPLVNTATVRLTNYQRNIRITKSTTETNGKALFPDIPEDRYELFVEAPNHQKVSRVIIPSFSESNLMIFLERNAVTYLWTVKPVQFEETYKVSLEADFETHVPMPVVTVEPREFDLEELELGLTNQIELNVTNHGLIRAENVGLGLPTDHPFLEFTFPGGNIGHVDALTSIILSVKIDRKSREKRGVRAYIYLISIVYNFLCGDWKDRLVKVLLKKPKEYVPLGPIPIPRNVSYDIPFNLTGPPSFDFIPFSAETPSFCNKCIQSILGCVPTPKFKAAGCIQTLAKGIPKYNDIPGLLDLITCRIDNPFLFVFKCVYNIGNDCIKPLIYGTNGTNSTNGTRKKRDVKDLTSDVYTSLHPIHMSMDLGIELFGDELWLQSGDTSWVNDIFKPSLDDSSDLGSLISGVEIEAILNVKPPNGASMEDTKLLLERINLTQFNWNQGKLEPNGTENMASFNKIQNLITDIEKFDTWAKDLGFTSYVDAYNTYSNEINKLDSWEEEAGVCAVVRIRIEQEIALTRHAFEGTLEIENKENSPLTAINLEIYITDDDTGENTTHKFSIGNPEVKGSLSGIQGMGVLPSGEIGSALWLIAPYTEAAPLEDKIYNIGGKLIYTFDDNDIEVPLLPAKITIKPNPSLLIHYFWEKYVVGDDPFTDEKESSEPYSLCVAIKNNGSGIARNMHISSGQPEIIENEKGLAVSFEIIGSEVGKNPGSSSLAVDFGDIHPNTTIVARWWMVSSLQGIFKNYSATFEYTNPLGDPKLSVLDELEIHELIRNVRIYADGADDDVLDFLVNDHRDAFDTPDILYDSINLQTYPVANGTVTAMRRESLNETTYLKLTGTSMDQGWVFFKIDVTDERQSWVGATSDLGMFSVITDDGLMEVRPVENRWITKTRKKAGAKYFLNFLDFLTVSGQNDFLIELCSNCTTTSEVTVPPPFTPPEFSWSTTMGPTTVNAKTTKPKTNQCNVISTKFPVYLAALVLAFMIVHQ